MIKAGQSLPLDPVHRGASELAVAMPLPLPALPAGSGGLRDGADHGGKVLDHFVVHRTRLVRVVMLGLGEQRDGGSTARAHTCAHAHMRTRTHRDAVRARCQRVFRTSLAAANALPVTVRV